MQFFALIAVLAMIVFSPFFASKAMGLKGGVGKGALVGFVTLGLIQMIGMVAQHLGPLGGIIGLLGGLAAWYHVIKVVHGTDTAGTFVFMFWHLFFQLLITSIIALLLDPSSVAWAWGL